MTTENALLILSKNDYTYVLPNDDIISEVHKALKNYFKKEFCKSIVVDTSCSIYDKVFIQDIDCPNEKEKLLMMKGFSDLQLIWIGMKALVEKFGEKTDE